MDTNEPRRYFYWFFVAQYALGEPNDGSRELARAAALSVTRRSGEFNSYSERSRRKTPKNIDYSSKLQAVSVVTPLEGVVTPVAVIKTIPPANLDSRSRRCRNILSHGYYLHAGLRLRDQALGN